MSDLAPERLFLLGTTLITLGAIGFHEIPGMISEDAEGHPWVNSFYCSVITLTTIGFGDICPTGKMNHLGQAFIVILSFCGMGMFCGPIITHASSWTKQIPGGRIGITLTTLIIGIIIFTTIEGMTHGEAIYFTFITGSTIGYGDMGPKTNEGKIATAIFALFIMNVVGGLLEPAKEFLSGFCLRDTKSDINTKQQQQQQQQQQQKQQNQKSNDSTAKKDN